MPHINKRNLATIGLVTGFIYDLSNTLALIRFDPIIDFIFDVIEYLSLIVVIYVHGVFHTDRLIKSIQLISRNKLMIYLYILLPVLLIFFIDCNFDLTLTNESTSYTSLIFILIFILLFLSIFSIISLLSPSIIKLSISGETNVLLGKVCDLPYPGFKKICLCFDKLMKSNPNNEELSILFWAIAYRHLSIIAFALFLLVSIVLKLFDIVLIPMIFIFILLFRAGHVKKDLDLDLLEQMLKRYDLIHAFKILFILLTGAFLLYPMVIFMFLVVLKLLVKHGPLFILANIKSFLLFTSLTLSFLLQFLSVYSIYVFLKRKISLNPIMINMGSMIIFSSTIGVLLFGKFLILLFPLIISASIIIIFLAILFRRISLKYSEDKIMLIYILNCLSTPLALSILANQFDWIVIIAFIFFLILYAVFWHPDKFRRISPIAVNYERYVGRPENCKDYIKGQLVKFEIPTLAIGLLFLTLLSLITPLDIYSILIIVGCILLCLELLIFSLLRDSYKVCILGGYRYSECFG